ncbi:MAG TPA: TlpA disulfide reductase family protein [Streptosporangiaceae bacterium]|nr:TlpA disulfide reductase family protein [Streptosporangiaceae bacterium]
MPHPVRAAALVIAAAAVLSTLTVLGLRWADAAKPASSGQQSDGLGFTKLDRAAPELKLPSLAGGGTITLTKMTGKPIVLNFWASTCTVCKKETPALASVARSLGSKVTFLGVDSVDQRSPAVKFEHKYGVSYPSFFDPEGAAAVKYDVPALPVTFFLSPSGKKILGENIGALTASRLRQILHEVYGTV